MSHVFEGFGFVGKGAVDLVELSGRHYSAIAAYGFAQDNVGVADGIVCFVEASGFVLCKVAYNAVSSFAKEPVGRKHKRGVVRSGGGESSQS